MHTCAGNGTLFGILINFVLVGSKICAAEFQLTHTTALMGCVAALSCVAPNLRQGATQVQQHRSCDILQPRIKEIEEAAEITDE